MGPTFLFLYLVVNPNPPKICGVVLLKIIVDDYDLSIFINNFAQVGPKILLFI